MSNGSTRPRGTGTVKARLLGGIMDGQSGETVSPPPDVLTFGENGGFVYKLDLSAQGKGATYRYDRAATRAKLRALGVPLALVDTATGDAGTAVRLAAGVDVRPDEGQTEVAVEVQRWPERWDALVAGEVVESLPRESIADDDHDAVRQWAESVGKTAADRYRLEGTSA